MAKVEGMHALACSISARSCWNYGASGSFADLTKHYLPEWDYEDVALCFLEDGTVDWSSLLEDVELLEGEWPASPR